MRARVRYTGRTFGSLVVLSERRVRESGSTRIRVTCKCECGKEISCLVHTLKNRKSCGCALDHAKKHGHARDSGASPTYKSWLRMKARLRPGHKHFANYGGRGVKMCKRWREFENFLADMGERPVGGTLDRIDSNGNYEPENCRWATRREQQNNRRETVKITFEGRTMALADWARERGIKHGTLTTRIKTGTPIERALDPAPIPPRNRNTKLTESDVVAVRKAHERGETSKAIASRHGVSRQTIDDICSGRAWADVESSKSRAAETRAIVRRLW